MTYGLFDADWQLYHGCPFFNLDLMKIARYYKNKKEIVSFSPLFCPEKYTHFIARQDYSRPTEYPYGKYSQVEVGGRVVNSTYKPLPIEIERTPADTLIYSPLEKTLSTEEAKRQFNLMVKSEHIRLSLDGENIWDDFRVQYRNKTGYNGIILHDYNPGVFKEAPALLRKELTRRNQSKNKSRIGSKFPIIVSNEEQFIDWASFYKINHFFPLTFDGIINHEYTEEIIKTCPRATLNDCTINVTNNITYEDFTTIGIINLFRFIVDLRSNGIKMQLNYDEDFLKDKEWGEILQLFSYFNTAGASKKTRYKDAYISTLYSYLKTASERSESFYGGNHLLTRATASDLFQFVREHNYELFVDFYERQGVRYDQ